MSVDIEIRPRRAKAEIIPDIKPFLIRDEFFKLYFSNLGVGNDLAVHRKTDIYDLSRKKKNEKFLFAIIRTSRGLEDLDENTIKSKQLVEKNKIKIMVTFFFINSILEMKQKMIQSSFYL